MSAKVTSLADVSGVEMHRTHGEPRTCKPWQNRPTGDFVVKASWSDSAGCGDDATLSIKQGDDIYITRVVSQGWAYAVSVEGEKGWVPASWLDRKVHVSSVKFEGGPGYAVLNV